MILPLVLAVVVAQATNAPIEQFLGVTAPSGYLEISTPGDATSRLWGRGDVSNSEVIILLRRSNGTHGSTQSYVTGVYLPGWKKIAGDYHIVSSRAVTVCGGPGWEIRERLTLQGTPTAQYSLFRATRDDIIEAHYQRSQSGKDDPRTIAAIQMLCPPK